MKISFLLTWADEMGGTEQAVFTQASHLADRHEVEVISVYRTGQQPFFPVDGRVRLRHLVDRTGAHPRPLRPTALDAGALRRLAAAPSALIAAAWEPDFSALSDVELKLALRTLDADVLVTTSPALMSAAADLAPASVVRVHQEHRPSQLRGRSGEPLLPRAPETDAVVVLTDRTREWFEESLGAAAPRLEAIPNAVPDGFRPRSSRTGRTVVLPRRLVPDKQIDHAITAFGAALAEHPGWQLRIFGDGPQRGRLAQLVQELGLHDSVHLLGPSRHMAGEWAKASFTVLPSRDGEAFPLVLLEAFAAGVPAISYDIVSGPAEIVRHGVDGLLVPPGDTEALAAAMARLMADEELLHRLGENALAGTARFEADVVGKRWEELFTELVGQPERARTSARADRAALRRARGGGAGRFFQPAAPVSRLAPSAGEQREREEELRAASGGELVRSAGQLAQVRDDLPAPGAYEENLRLVVAALQRAGVPYAPPRATSRIAVPAGRRGRVCRALAAAYRGQAVYAELLGPARDAPGAVLAERLADVGEVRGLRVYRPYVTSGRTLRYGPGYGCEIEFGHGYADGRAEFDGPRATGIGFPVDAVYTWVDDSDPAWRERLAARRPATGGGGAAARFRNRDELRYSLRSLAMFAPWIRRVFLVTDDQIPAWLADEHPGLEVVPHREIFEDPSALPVFNSHAIESQLHRIEGLAEHFLYLNDDVFFGRTVGPGQFFLPGGGTRFFWSPTAIPAGEATADDDGAFAAAKNNRRLLRERFGTTVTSCFAHAPHALRRSVLAEISREFAADVTRTARAPLRDWRDISLASSLHHHYGYLTGTAEPGALRVAYVDVGRGEQHPKLGKLLSGRSWDAFCLGEGPAADVPAEEQAEVVRAFLEAYFPVPGPHEQR